MRRIAFINEKGGTCKTTLCVNVAALKRRLEELEAMLDGLSEKVGRGGGGGAGEGR